MPRFPRLHLFFLRLRHRWRNILERRRHRRDNATIKRQQKEIEELRRLRDSDLELVHRNLKHYLGERDELKARHAWELESLTAKLRIVTEQRDLYIKVTERERERLNAEIKAFVRKGEDEINGK